MPRPLAVLFALLFLLAGCGGGGFLGEGEVEPPEATLADIRFAEAGFLEQTLELDLRFTNPNDVAIRGDGLRVTLELDGRRFGRGVSDEAFTLPRLGEEVVPVRLRVATGDVMDRLLDLGDAAAAVPYSIEGVVFTDNAGRLPFSSTASIRLPSLDRLNGGRSSGG